MTNASARRLPGSRQPARRCSFTASLRPGGEPWWGQSVPNVLSVMKMRFYSSPVSDGGAWGLSPLREGWGVRRGGRAVSWVGGPRGCPLTTSWLLKRGGDARHGHLLACAEIEPLPATPSGKLTSPTSYPRPRPGDRDLRPELTCAAASMRAEDRAPRRGEGARAHPPAPPRGASRVPSAEPGTTGTLRARRLGGQR